MKLKKGDKVVYYPPNGKKRRCVFMRAHKDTPSGEWWDLVSVDVSQPIRARPKSVKLR